MARILLLLSHAENRRLLASWLAPHHDVIQAPAGDSLAQPFDLGIVDGHALQQYQERIHRRKVAEEPVMLPILLLTPQIGLNIATHELWHSVDDLLTTPVEKALLDARVKLLLQARNFSLQLKHRNDDLQAMVHALNHDLRAPARISASFAQALREDYGGQLDERGRHYIERIRFANERSRKLLDQLLEFAQLGRGAVDIQETTLEQMMAVVLNNVEDEYPTFSETQVTVQHPLPTIQADFGLLELALTNLVSNALKYVAEGDTPQVTIAAHTRQGVCRITVADRGIGIPTADQARIFQPFVRLYSEESYSGTGLGLAAAHKAVELMGGRLGVHSTPGAGSTFWIELPCGGSIEDSDRRR